MTKYLISFPSSAMQQSPQDLQEASDATRAIVREAKEAGIWVFGGALDETVVPAMVDAKGVTTKGTYPETRHLDGGYCILELPSYDEAVVWAAKLAAACRCAQELRAFHYDPEN